MVILSSCSSYFSIEKRKYRDGFYVHQNIFHKEKQEEILTQSQQISDSDLDRKVLQSNPDSVFSENISTLSAENDKGVKNILTVWKPIQFRKIVFQKDTLPEKKKESSSKINETKQLSAGDRKTPSLVLISFLLWIIGLLTIIIYIGLAFFIAGIVTSIIAINKIKKNRDKYKGMGFAIASLILCLIPALVVIGMLTYAVMMGSRYMQNGFPTRWHASVPRANRRSS